MKAGKGMHQGNHMQDQLGLYQTSCLIIIC